MRHFEEGFLVWEGGFALPYCRKARPGRHGIGRWPALPVRLVEKSRVNALHNLRYTGGGAPGDFANAIRRVLILSMKRPQAHTTDSLGEAQMRAVFEPHGWAVNKIQHDYGVDFDVQIFKDGEATGEWFKVQLKSSSATKYSSNGEFIQQPLETSHAIHYAQDMREPIFIIHADTERRNTFWYTPQLDDELPSLNPEVDAQKTVTVRIPTRNALPGTIKEMIEVLQRAQIILGARRIINTPIGDFADTIRKHGNLQAVFQSFKDKLDAMKLQEAHKLFQEKRYIEAKQKVKAILEDKESSVEMKFSAIFQEGDIRWVEGVTQRSPQSELTKLRLETAKSLQLLARKGPAALKFYGLIARKAAELEVLTFRDFGLYMNWKTQTQRGDPVIALAVYIELVQSARLVARKYNQCVRLARYAAESPHAWAVPTALLKIVEGVVSFTIRAEEDQQEVRVTAYSKSGLDICRLAGSIAAMTGDDDSLDCRRTGNTGAQPGGWNGGEYYCTGWAGNKRGATDLHGLPVSLILTAITLTA